MKPTSNFPKQFTKPEITRLEGAGLNSLYSLITYFPFRLQTITPFTNSSQDTNLHYLITASILNIEFRNSGKGYFLLSLMSENGQRIEGYLFQNQPYIKAELKLGLTFQWLVQISAKGFLNIVKWSSFKGYQQNSFYVLGKAELKNWMVPVYQKIGVLTSAKINLSHQKLQEKDYTLNLQGLVPENPFFSLNLNLLQIHKPSSAENYYKTKQQWIAFKLFLKMATYKQIKLGNEVLMAKKSNMKLDTLKQMSASIPFQLTNSQKTTIWDILNKLGSIQ